MKLKRQLDAFYDYDAFVEKFKPKKTTDDCMTPDNIYNEVVRWAADEYKAVIDAVCFGITHARAINVETGKVVIG